MDFYRQPVIQNEAIKNITFTLVYVSYIIFTFQFFLIAYINSTYLEKFIHESLIGVIYAISSFIAIFLTLILPRILRHLGNVNTVILTMGLVIICLIIVGFAPTTSLTITAFIIALALAPQIYFCMDIFLETLIGKQEADTGSKRGLVLSLTSFGLFLSPLIMGFLLQYFDSLSSLYYISAIFGFIFIILIISFFRQFYDPKYVTIKLRDLIKTTYQNRNINTVLKTQFLLQFFYTWAVIYIPLYMATVIGFDWTTIAQIIAVGLLAFVIFEYPIGIVADKYIGEKEMMAIGFVILALSCAILANMNHTNVIGWMVLMFISRIGASLVEVTSESYFFKKVSGDDSSTISLFRLMRPGAGLLGAIVGSVSLLFLPFQYIFFILSFFMISGAFITQKLVDTK